MQIKFRNLKLCFPIVSERTLPEGIKPILINLSLSKLADYNGVVTSSFQKGRGKSGTFTRRARNERFNVIVSVEGDVSWGLVGK